jgi:3-mercaptopyruvate sulfurtransferase SseA
LKGLPRGRRVVAYCRGPYCVLAAEAVRLLRKRGVEAVRLKEGYPEWRDAGLPVEDGAVSARTARPASTNRAQRRRLRVSTGKDR